MKNVRQSSFTSLYYRYKDTTYFAAGLFGVVVLVCLSLVLFFVIPQVQNWLNSNAEVEELRAKVAALNENVAFLNKLDSDEVKNQFLQVTSEYPVEKDFGGAMQQIMSSAIKSGVTLKEFQFTVGEIGTRSAVVKKTEVASPLEITLAVEGDAQSLKEFVKSTAERVPHSQVESATSENGSETTFKILFPSNPIKDASFTKTDPIKPLTPSQRKLLDQIAIWQENSKDTLDDSSASTSATLPPPF